MRLRGWALSGRLARELDECLGQACHVGRGEDQVTPVPLRVFFEAGVTIILDLYRAGFGKLEVISIGFHCLDDTR